MDDVLRGLMAEFKKSELLEIAKELDLEMSRGVRAPTLISSILKNLDDEGVPEPDDCSDVLWEFLVAAEYIDEDGNLLELEEDDDEKEGGNELQENGVEKIDHKCYGYHDPHDPACRKCKVSDQCIIKRQADLLKLECYGLLFDKSDPECGSCIEASGCRKKFEK